MLTWAVRKGMEHNYREVTFWVRHKSQKQRCQNLGFQGMLLLHSVYCRSPLNSLHGETMHVSYMENYHNKHTVKS